MAATVKSKQKSGYASYSMHVDVVTAASLDTTPSFLLELGLRRYLFNAGDGVQRFCLEHGVRLARCDHVFITRLDPTTLGGLAGLLLTLDDNGTHSVTLIGPVGLGAWAKALRHVVARPNLRVTVLECGAGGGAFDDGTLQATAVPLTSSKRAAVVPVAAVAAEASVPHAKKRRRRGGVRHLALEVRSMASLSPLTSDASASAAAAAVPDALNASASAAPDTICFVCRTPAIRGSFYPERAAALGVPKGRLWGELANGRAVALADGTIVHPATCKATDTPGRVFIVVSCPTARVAAAIATRPELRAEAFGDELVCVFHSAPWDVLRSPTYVAWMRSLGAAVQHVVASRELASGGPSFAASHRTQLRLRALLDASAPGRGVDIFPLLRGGAGAHSVAELGVDRAFAAQPRMRFVMLPIKSSGVREWSELASTRDGDGYRRMTATVGVDDVDAVAAAAAAASADEHLPFAVPPRVATARGAGGETTEEGQATALSLSNAPPAVTFLGTGSALPSKYRSVSAIWLRIDGMGNGVLLDAGEGTYGQMARLGLSVDAVRCVWISHMHADHHLGLVRVISERSKASAGVPPLPVIGPRPLGEWLHELAQCGVLPDSTRWRFYDSERTVERPEWGWSRSAKSVLVAGGAEGVASAASAAAQSERELLAVAMAQWGVRFSSVRVCHCKLAYGLVVRGAIKSSGATWKLVYSGDTRPGGVLIDAGKDCDVLIHEATFEDDLIVEAKKKRHSTVGEAIDVGRRMGARHTVLTHFSQRYPKAVRGGGDSAGGDDVICAFDFMRFHLADLAWLGGMRAAVEHLLRPRPAEAEAV